MGAATNTIGLQIFNWLKTKFQTGDGCWTSNARSRAGLSSFEEFEGDYADFTIVDAEVRQRITSWLVDCGHIQHDLADTVTYHLEVKTTVGRRGEPFEMSNRQVAMVSTWTSMASGQELIRIQAEMWHQSDADIYIILRVYDFNSSPKVYAYFDPHGLRLNGKLSFTAQGGYYVRPA